jgi:antitoxin CcdA
MNIQQSRRKATNVALDPNLVADARAEGINLSRACEAGLAAELKKIREERWLEENREAIAGWNTWMEENELPLAKYRQI